MIGPRLAVTIKEQIGGTVDQQEWERVKAADTAQSALTAFIEEEYEDNLKYEVEAAVECFKTKDLAEGIAAVLEKRRGKFTGE